jgi:hypothetical protein
MNTMPGSYAPPGMRASDADRDVVLAELTRGFEAGRLTPDELDERTSRALTARTMGDLAALTADLPAGQPQGAGTLWQPAASADFRPRRGRLPAITAIAALVIVAVVLSSVAVHASWHLWWIVPAVIILVRRAAGRAARPGPFQRD